MMCFDRATCMHGFFWLFVYWQVHVYIIGSSLYNYTVLPTLYRHYFLIVLSKPHLLITKHLPPRFTASSSTNQFPTLWMKEPSTRPSYPCTRSCRRIRHSLWTLPLPLVATSPTLGHKTSWWVVPISSWTFSGKSSRWACNFTRDLDLTILQIKYDCILDWEFIFLPTCNY